MYLSDEKGQRNYLHLKCLNLFPTHSFRYADCGNKKTKQNKYDITERDESKLRNIFAGLTNMQVESDEFILKRQTQQVNETSDFNTRDDYNHSHMCIV